MVTNTIRTGVVIYWSLAEWTDREALFNGWTKRGHNKLVPEPRPAVAVLKDALLDVVGNARTLVRPLATKDGWAVVGEDRGEAENSYQPLFSVRVPEGTTEPTFTGCPSQRDLILEAFRQHTGRFASCQVGTALVALLDKLGGTRLRPTGGVYWLPGDKVEEWREAMSVVEYSAVKGRTTGYSIEHPLDHEAVAAVHDAILAEVGTEARRLKQEIESGELGPRALETRKKEAAFLREKVVQYEDLLNVGMDKLKQQLEGIEQTTAVSTLLLSTFGSDHIEQEGCHVGAA